MRIAINQSKKFQGFNVFIENEAGSLRHGKDWTQLMANAYGYIEDTIAIDGDELDCFLGPNENSEHIFIVEQLNEDGAFDEYKVMLGFNSVVEAKEAYLANYQEGWNGLGYVIERDIFNFWDWYKANTKESAMSEDKKDRKMENRLKWDQRFETKETKLNRGKDRYATKKVENCKTCKGHGTMENGKLCTECDGVGY